MQMKWLERRLIISLMITIAILNLALAPTDKVWAHGDVEATEVFRGHQGAYEIVVGMIPNNPVVGNVHFTIIPLETYTSTPITDAEIIIVVNNDLDQPAYQVRAVNTPKTPESYDANVKIESPGKWTLIVKVRSAHLGEATVTIPIDVAEQAITPGSVGGIVWLGIVIVLLVGSTYIWFSSRR